MTTSDVLIETLGLAQRFGFLGAAPIEDVIEHARRFVSALPHGCARVVDIGAGGGTPGLVLAVDRPDLEVVLLDRRARRTDFLVRAVHRLELADRVTVLTGDAAVLGRRSPWRASFDAAVARGLGAPPVTAALCRPFVRDGGVLVVSEPPSDQRRTRWPAQPLARLGWSVDPEQFVGVIRLMAEGPIPADLGRSAISVDWIDS